MDSASAAAAVISYSSSPSFLESYSNALLNDVVVKRVDGSEASLPLLLRGNKTILVLGRNLL